MIKFFIPLRPVPQARPRTFYHKQSGRIVTMNPRDSENYKQAVTSIALKHKPSTPIDEPVFMRLDFLLERPASAKKRPWPTVRPDLDNYEKGTIDALTNAKFFVDDSRIVKKSSLKRYPGNGLVGIHVVIDKAVSKKDFEDRNYWRLYQAESCQIEEEGYQLESLILAVFRMAPPRMANKLREAFPNLFRASLLCEQMEN